MSALPNPVAAGDPTTPPRKSRWKRWVFLADVVAAGVMTYISIAVLGILTTLVENATDSNIGDHPVLAVLLAAFLFFVNLFIAVVGSIVLIVFGFVGVLLFGGRDKTASTDDNARHTNRTEP
jgi:chromate transport protein ChrA